MNGNEWLVQRVALELGFPLFKFRFSRLNLHHLRDSSKAWCIAPELTFAHALVRPQAAIRKELNEFKSNEMEVHSSSKHLTRSVGKTFFFFLIKAHLIFRGQCSGVQCDSKQHHPAALGVPPATAGLLFLALSRSLKTWNLHHLSALTNVFIYLTSNLADFK